MITVYGADWCEDTRRSLRHLRRLGVAHLYRNIDEDSEALDRARTLDAGAADARRTPVVDLGLGGGALVEPDNDTLTGALVEMQMLSTDEAVERLAVQNVGDLERVVRTAAGLLLLGAATATPPRAKSLVRITGCVVALSGVSGWCPAYQLARRTSIGGPGDRPDETTRTRWLAPSGRVHMAAASGADGTGAEAGAGR
jgi:glutaredoxin